MQATLSPQQRGELMVGEPVAADHGEADEEADELAGEVVEGVGELAHVPGRAQRLAHPIRRSGA